MKYIDFTTSLPQGYDPEQLARRVRHLAARLSANAEQAFRTRFTYYHAGKEVGAQVSESEVV